MPTRGGDRTLTVPDLFRYIGLLIDILIFAILHVAFLLIFVLSTPHPYELHLPTGHPAQLRKAAAGRFGRNYPRSQLPTWITARIAKQYCPDSKTLDLIIFERCVVMWANNVVIGSDKNLVWIRFQLSAVPGNFTPCQIPILWILSEAPLRGVSHILRPFHLPFISFMDADTFDGMATGAAASDTPSRPIDNDSQTMDDTHASESPQRSKNESAQSLPGKEVDRTMTPQVETSLHLFLGKLDSESETEAKLAELSAILAASPEDIDTRSLKPPHKTPLQIAIRKDVSRTFNLLIQAGADVNVLDGENTHSFHHALKYWNSPYLKVLLERATTTWDPTFSGRCFLHDSDFYHQEESIMRRVFEFQRHFLNEQSSFLLQTPLNYTVLVQKKEGVAFLLEQEPDLGIVDCHGWSPLMTALKTSTSEIFDILVNYLFEPGRESTAKDVIIQNNNAGKSIFVEFCELSPEHEAWEASFAKLLDNIVDKFPHLDFNTTPVYEGLLDFAIFSTKHSKSKIVGEFAFRVVGWVLLDYEAEKGPY
ncbi:uncharacterized protein CLUP02_16235 [Colletotrichum lupini]|uniref:Ankyrin repeat protein n=1 Tax=Colletotrichum lupini TaxID=145971 RepID=A0A9Q8T825_9PEZI|nr:uncharacterized protein CLUP02_16235 [Colletotrichum lupini]UQC90705.1 hypothetical protein CLUP02_16235 [Colletotrichum lupini]